MFSVGPIFFLNQGGDPLFASVRALYHMDGVNNGTSFPNSVPGTPAATRQGNIQPVTTTSVYKFPTASGAFPSGRGGDEGWLFIPNYNSGFNFGTGDICIEGWFYPQYANQLAIIANYNLSSTLFWINASGYLEWQSPAGTLTSTGTLLLNQWNYVVMDRNAGTMRLYINGTQVGSGSVPGAIDFLNYMSLGRIGSTSYYNWYGYIDELRITAASRYTSSTIPVPTQPFPDF